MYPLTRWLDAAVDQKHSFCPTAAHSSFHQPLSAMHLAASVAWKQDSKMLLIDLMFVLVMLSGTWLIPDVSGTATWRVCACVCLSFLSGDPKTWQNKSLPGDPNYLVGANCVSVLIDHFWRGQQLACYWMWDTEDLSCPLPALERGHFATWSLNLVLWHCLLYWK